MFLLIAVLPLLLLPLSSIQASALYPLAGDYDATVFERTIHLPVGTAVVGFCEPYVITSRGVLDLSLWVYTYVSPEDLREVVGCDSNFLVVLGQTTVYFISRDTGTLVKSVPVGDRYVIGYDSGQLAVLYSNNMVLVSTVSASGDYIVYLDVSEDEFIADIEFVAYNGLPYLFYIVTDGEAGRLAYSTLSGSRTIIDVGSGATGLYVVDNYVVVESDVIRVFEIVNAIWPVIVERPEYNLYVPLDIADFVMGDVTELYATTTDDSVVRINLDDKNWEFIGVGRLTNAGLYVTELNTTFVEYGGVVYPVTGMAVDRIGNIVLTNVLLADDEGNVDVVGVFWPLVRSVLVATEPIDGVLQLVLDDGEIFSIRLEAPPGTYYLPMGASILTDDNLILLNSPEVYYPLVPEDSEPVDAGIVTYSVALFPENYQVLDEFSGVRFVGTGDDRILIITQVEAILYSQYGVTTKIPGAWLWGGVSSTGIVLYDGATLRIYDIAGNPVGAFQAIAIREPPLYVTVAIEGTEYKVYVYLSEELIVVSRSDVERVAYGPPVITATDTGIKITLTGSPKVEYGEFSYTIPSFETISMNEYRIAWVSESSWYVLDLENKTVYVLRNAPEGSIYPTSTFIAFLNSDGVLQILPYKAWLALDCYVEVLAPDDADIYIDDILVGKGPLTYYTTCDVEVTVKAVKEYHDPDVKTVTVVPGGVTVTLEPTPRYSDVTLRVLAPEGVKVESMTVVIDGEPVEWRNGDTIRLIRGKPYEIRVESASPYDICLPTDFGTVTFESEAEELIVPCNLTTSVLILTSMVDTIASIIHVETGAEVVTVQVLASTPTLVPIEAGAFTIVSKPLVEGYAERSIEVVVPDASVVNLDITPFKYGTLMVYVVPETAEVQLLDEQGNLIASEMGGISRELPPGVYQIVVSAPGYFATQEVVEMVAGESQTLEIVLQPATQPQPQEEPIWASPIVQIGILLLVVLLALGALWYRRRRSLQSEVPEEELVEEGGGGS